MSALASAVFRRSVCSLCTASRRPPSPPSRRPIQRTREAQIERLGRASGARRRPRVAHVLLIGDSILGGYHGKAAELLRGKVNLDVWITPSTSGSRTYPRTCRASSPNRRTT